MARALSFVLLLLTGLAGYAAALSNACDDAMGGDEGFGLKKIKALPPRAPYKWVVPLVDKAIRDPTDLNAIFTFPKGSPKKKGCKVQSYTWRKLCVPKDGSKGEFRAKVQLKSNCGVMVVKYRISLAGEALEWGRSAS